MLTAEQIRAILYELRWRTVFLHGTNTRLQELTMGYSEDADRAKLQAKLSIMLEAAPKC